MSTLPKYDVLQFENYQKYSEYNVGSTVTISSSCLTLNATLINKVWTLWNSQLQKFTMVIGWVMMSLNLTHSPPITISCMVALMQYQYGGTMLSSHWEFKSSLAWIWCINGKNWRQLRTAGVNIFANDHFFEPTGP